jgi:CubicO group peptidase (beta-lactamase class C family)
MTMQVKKIIKRIVIATLVVAIGYGVYYAWVSFPIVSGYSAKNACSCAFIQGRDKASIKKEDLNFFPLTLGSIEIDYKDSSVTGTVWGMAKRKAIYRAGFGCTLVNEASEDQLRRQKFPLNIPVAKQDTVDWPLGDRVTNSAFHNPLLDSAIDIAFDQKYKDKDVLTRALIVVHNDSVIAERYASGYNKESKFLGWSMAKSVTSALIGVLVKQGKLKVDQPAPVPEWKDANDKRHKITVEHLLQQTSGLDFTENYSKFSSVTNMLFNKGNMAAYTATLPLKYEPGSHFNYSSGNSNVLSRIIRNAVGEKDYVTFPYTDFFYKIDMYNTLLEPDASGTYVGSSYVYASARDYARFGLLYLKDGVWNGERILPEGWVRQTVTPPSANQTKDYGYQFWLNGFSTNGHNIRDLPQLPDDVFYADGYGYQRIYIIPSMKLVVVRMGVNAFNEYAFLDLLAAAFKPSVRDRFISGN